MKPTWMQRCSGDNCDVCESLPHKGRGDCLDYNNTGNIKDIRLNNMQKNELIEDMACCGNCFMEKTRQCKFYQLYRDTGSYPTPDSYCDIWIFDGLNRKDRKRELL